MSGGKRRHEDDFDTHCARTFVFRDPDEVFREFFGGTSFEDLFSIPEYFTGTGARRGSCKHIHRGNNSISSSFFGPLGFGGFSQCRVREGVSGNFTSFKTFTAFDGNNVDGSVKRTSTSTRFINDKKITTKKVYENGEETIMSYENDVLKSKTVNGVPQPITYS